MPEWLQQAVATSGPPAFGVMVTRVLFALVLGFPVAWLHSCCKIERRTDRVSVPTTLVLLSVLICLITMIIGESVARAFGLVGALSIVRFRTVIEDTRDTAFVIFAVAVGMAVGSGYLALPLLGLPAVAVILASMEALRGLLSKPLVKGALDVRINLGDDAERRIAAVVDRFAAKHQLSAASTVRQGSAYELRLVVWLADRERLLPMVAELSKTPGVQSVEYKTE
jgi:uncharacterized membrane protein YhiD involved in acid resistance